MARRTQTQILFSDAERATIKRAAEIERRPFAAMVRYAALEHAEEVIREDAEQQRLAEQIAPD